MLFLYQQNFVHIMCFFYPDVAEGMTTKALRNELMRQLEILDTDDQPNR